MKKSSTSLKCSVTRAAAGFRVEERCQVEARLIEVRIARTIAGLEDVEEREASSTRARAGFEEL